MKGCKLTGEGTSAFDTCRRWEFAEWCEGKAFMDWVERCYYCAFWVELGEETPGTSTERQVFTG